MCIFYQRIFNPFHFIICRYSSETVHLPFCPPNLSFACQPKSRVSIIADIRIKFLGIGNCFECLCTLLKIMYHALYQPHITTTTTTTSRFFNWSAPIEFLHKIFNVFSRRIHAEKHIDKMKSSIKVINVHSLQSHKRHTAHTRIDRHISSATYPSVSLSVHSLTCEI